MGMPFQVQKWGLWLYTQRVCIILKRRRRRQRLSTKTRLEDVDLDWYWTKLTMCRTWRLLMLIYQARNCGIWYMPARNIHSWMYYLKRSFLHHPPLLLWNVCSAAVECLRGVTTEMTATSVSAHTEQAYMTHICYIYDPYMSIYGIYVSYIDAYKMSYMLSMSYMCSYMSIYVHICHMCVAYKCSQYVIYVVIYVHICHICVAYCS